MFESDGECGLLPEDVHDKHMSVMNKSCLQQYKLSLQSASNIVSNDLLNCSWNVNQDLFNNEGTNLIIKSASELLQNTDISQMKSWRTGLNTINDTESMFEQAIPTCPTCSSNSSHSGLNEFFRNICSCEVNIIDKNKTNNRSTDTGGMSVPFMNLNSEHSNQEAKSEEGRQVFKPRFGRQRYSNKTAIQAETNIPSTCDEVNFEKEDEENKAHKSNVAKITFKTARDQLLATNPAAKRTLGTSRKAQAKFVSPMIGVQEKQESVMAEVSDERLKHIDPKMIELIESEILDKGTPIGWDDIAGLELAKSVIQEAVVWPLLRPDIFTGLRRPPKGILLFGPPGTGKTLIGKCIASQCNATFFSISASSLTSKWIGDGEKMVRALFAVARCHQPAVIFIDEIDSLLTQRNETEHEATRRIKTEFLVQFDGAATGEEDRLLIVGATNRPQELDEAARRRLVKRLYIPLPDIEARQQIISNLLKREYSEVSAAQAREVAARCAGYSGADVRALCCEAALGPVRALPLARVLTVPAGEVRPVNVQDFVNALQRVKPSVSQDDLGQYVKWNKTYGHGL